MTAISGSARDGAAALRLRRLPAALRHARHLPRPASWRPRFWSPSFLTERNILNVLRQVAPSAGIMAVGMLYVILTRGIDLSVGSISALGSVLMRLFHSRFPASACRPRIVLVLLSGAACGLVTGGFVAYLQAAVLRDVAGDDGDRARPLADLLGRPADPDRRRRARPSPISGQATGSACRSR